MSKYRVKQAEPKTLVSKKPLLIALDGMGGDNAPHAVVSGAAIAKTRIPDVKFLLYGDEEKLKPLVDAHANLKDSLEIYHTEDKIKNTDKPSQILRAGKKSSMNLAIKAVAEQKAAAVISSGNTGGLMALSMFGLKKLPNVTRPAIASFFPTTTGETCLLDLGGNVEATARNLLEFMVMGEAFMATAMGIKKPRVALLNIGTEDEKGRTSIKQAATLVKQSHLDINFTGYVEADAISLGMADVIVTDGFTGNIVIKTAAGVAKLIKHYLQSSISASPMARLSYPFYVRALKNTIKHADPRNYNGAVFLGLEGIAIKSHGSSDKVGFASAIELACDLIKYDTLKRMRGNLAALQELGKL